MVYSNSDRYDCKCADIAVVENACNLGDVLLKVSDDGCSVVDIVED